MDNTSQSPKPTIASFWMGDRLSFIEQLCLKSFVDIGHETILYSYEEITNIPLGVKSLDARMILPEKEYLDFKGKEKPAPAVFSDKFRVYLMLKTDAIWIDCDIYACKAFEPLEYILPLEFSFQLSNAVLRLPKNSLALKQYAEFLNTPFPKFPDNWTNQAHVMEEVNKVRDAAQPTHILDLKYYHWGPFALTYFTKQTGEFKKALPSNLFFPIPGFKTQQILRPYEKMPHKIPSNGWAIHFYSSLLKRKLQARVPDGNLPKRSFLNSLCEKHGIEPREAPV